MIWPWQDRKGDFSWLKALTFALMFVPALWLYYDYLMGHYGRLPLAGLTYWSGVWATAILLLALAVTPAMVLFRWNRLVLLRRMIGVSALVYTILHILIYFALRFWNFASIAYEMATRVSLIIATISTIGLAILGATSLDSAVARMGAERWQRLHNWVYWLSALALAHFLLSPGVYSMQYLMAGVFFWLMAWRMLHWRGRAMSVLTLAQLAVVSCLVTAFVEAGWTWVYQEFDPIETLGNNFSLILGISPAWEVLGMAAAIAAVAALRARPAR